MTTLETLDKELARHARAAGWTPTTLSAKLGIRPAAISFFLKEKGSLPVSKLMAICEALNLDMEIRITARETDYAAASEHWFQQHIDITDSHLDFTTFSDMHECWKDEIQHDSSLNGFRNWLLFRLQEEGYNHVYMGGKNESGKGLHGVLFR